MRDVRSDAQRTSARVVTWWNTLLNATFVLALSACGLLVDQLSKGWALSAHAGSASAREVLPGLFAGVPLMNEGTVAHLGGGSPLAGQSCALCSLAVLAVMAYSGRTHLRRCQGLEPLGVSLLLAGLLGNTLDRLTFGYVRDFLTAGCWPELTFNLADIFLVLGAGLMLAQWVVPRLTHGPAGAAARS